MEAKEDCMKTEVLKNPKMKNEMDVCRLSSRFNYFSFSVSKVKKRQKIMPLCSCSISLHLDPMINNSLTLKSPFDNRDVTYSIFVL